MYIYHKTYHKSSHICECENRSLLLKGCHRGQKSVLTELDWANPCQSSETAAPMRDLGANVAPRPERPAGSQTHKSRRGLGEARYTGTLGDLGPSLGQPC